MWWQLSLNGQALTSLVLGSTQCSSSVSTSKHQKADVNACKRSLRCLWMELNPPWLIASSAFPFSPKLSLSLFVFPFHLFTCSPCSYVSYLIPRFVVSYHHLFWNNVFKICSWTRQPLFIPGWTVALIKRLPPPDSKFDTNHLSSHLSFIFNVQTCLFVCLLAFWGREIFH